MPTLSLRCLPGFLAGGAPAITVPFKPGPFLCFLISSPPVASASPGVLGQSHCVSSGVGAIAIHYPVLAQLNSQTLWSPRRLPRGFLQENLGVRGVHTDPGRKERGGTCRAELQPLTPLDLRNQPFKHRLRLLVLFPCLASFLYSRISGLHTPSLPDKALTYVSSIGPRVLVLGKRGKTW